MEAGGFVSGGGKTFVGEDKDCSAWVWVGYLGVPKTWQERR